ncbi:MAG: penicillin-binding protein 2 [Bacteroidota bacterium]|nr:penicillin-binding protein 2 [Bacteroidota bacterium]MDP4225519.1 penicillin-binding protein 2 [Bacteroidota bacterium]MDP4273457.1 penicillin-binding protein 2 [Bacteroidota bacterium]
MNHYAVRKYIIGSLFVLFSVILLARLLYIQVIDTSYKLSAENISRRFIIQYPSRGIIYDRNGKVLVYNEIAYDLMVNPWQLTRFDTTELCSILDIPVQQARDAIQAAKDYSKYKPSIFLKQVSPEAFAVLQERLFKFPGFYVQPRTLRVYPAKIAAAILGYVGEVNENVIKKSTYYHMGDYIGISGIEKSYEYYLRGRKGVNIYIVDVHNRIKGPFQNGRFDTIALAGNNLTSTIDEDLQAYGEKLMANYRGSIVAIEPSSGEILSLVTSPSYDPSLLVGRKRTVNYVDLMRDPSKPLFNRALMAKYPPGSTFKMINGLIGLQEGVIVPGTEFSCSRGYHVGNFTVACHPHVSPLNLPQAIQNSCNAYFCNVFRRIIDNHQLGDTKSNFNTWRNYVMSFGLGKKIESDLPNELSGNVPSSRYYDKYFGVHGWHSLTVISLAIGQGELGITPLQNCNVAAIMANRGFYYPPHIIKSVQGQPDIDPKFKIRHNTAINPMYFEPIVQGMDASVNAGGTSYIAHIDGITVCGKTGTAQNPHGKDHSIFIAFAPKDHPKIAIAVYIENAGFGATYAAPIASLMIEKYLTHAIKRQYLEDWLLKTKIEYGPER